MIFFVLSGKMVFFPGKYDIFSLDGKWKMIFLKRNLETWHFLYICINITNMILPFCKKSKMNCQKNTKGDYWLHSRKSSNNSLYFHGDLNRRFHILLSSEKKTRNSIFIGLEFDFFFNLFGWRYSIMKNLLYFVPFFPQELYLEVCLSAN